MSNDEGIRLHPKYGVNPKLTFCPRCGGEGQDIVLLGIRSKKGKCSQHGTVYGTMGINCAVKGCYEKLSGVVEIGESERIPGGLCKNCEEEVTTHRKIVEEGGIYFRCAEKGCQGVVKGSSELTKMVREQLKVYAPNACGVEFAKCVEHGGEEKC